MGTGLVLDKGRETIGTTILDAEPDVILKMPGDSYLPLLVAVAMAAVFTCMLLHSWSGAGIAAVATFIASVVWLWPRRVLAQIET